MEHKKNYIQAINFINLISYTMRRRKTKKNKAQSRKMGLQFLQCILMVEFHYIEPKCKSHSHFR